MKIQNTRQDTGLLPENHSDAKENPFYNNYVFSDKDLKRVKIRWWEHPFIWFLPTYVQVHTGGSVGDSIRYRNIFYYKVWGGRYYLIKIEELELTFDKDIARSRGMLTFGAPA